MLVCFALGLLHGAYRQFASSSHCLFLFLLALSLCLGNLCSASLLKKSWRDTMRTDEQCSPVAHLWSWPDHLDTQAVVVPVSMWVREDPDFAWLHNLLGSQQFRPINSPEKDQLRCNQSSARADDSPIERLCWHQIKLPFLFFWCWLAYLILLTDHHWDLHLSWDFFKSLWMFRTWSCL